MCAFLLTLESSCRVCLLVCVSFLVSALTLMFVTIGLFVVSRWCFYSFASVGSDDL